MSASTYTFTCIGSDADALCTLHGKLLAAIGTPCSAWPELLGGIFADWDQPSVLSASLLGTTLRCSIDASAHDALEKAQILALHAAGAEYLRVQVFNSQVGESDTTHHHAGKRIAAKAFPKPALSEGDRLYELVLESKDGALAKEIKAGASADAAAQGMPLFMHALRGGMEKSLRAMFDARVDLAPCLPWATEAASQIAQHGGSRREAMLVALLALPGADLVALSRSVAVVQTVCAHPKLLKWLLAQEGVDVNARLYEEESAQEVGSLLFHSVEFFQDSAEVLAVLEARGACSVPPLQMSDVARLDRMRCGYRDAETPAQLAAAGVDLDTSVWRDDYPAVRMLLRNFQGAGCAPRPGTAGCGRRHRWLADAGSGPGGGAGRAARVALVRAGCSRGGGAHCPGRAARGRCPRHLSPPAGARAQRQHPRRVQRRQPGGQGRSLCYAPGAL